MAVKRLSLLPELSQLQRVLKDNIAASDEGSIRNEQAGKAPKTIQRVGVLISSCMGPYSPEKMQQIWSTHTPLVSHQGGKGETNHSMILICVLSPLVCFHHDVLDGKKIELMNMSLKNIMLLNLKYM